MKNTNRHHQQAGIFTRRIVVATALCSCSAVLLALSCGAARLKQTTFRKNKSLGLATATTANIMPVPTPTSLVQPGSPCPSGSVSSALVPGYCVPALSTGSMLHPQPGVMPARANVGGENVASADWTLHSRREPIRREAPQLAYDAAHGVVVMFGGGVCQGASCFVTNETWTFDGTRWTEQHPASSPNPRYLATMVYDAKRSKVVLFGGVACIDAACTDTNSASDTWSWDGTTWTQENPAISPPARYLSTMIYDLQRQRVLLYGGCLLESCYTVGADLWAWDGSNWSLVDANAPPGARFGSHFAYDAAHQQAVLFGGATATSGGETSQPDLGDTWTFDGTTWTKQSPATSPSPREVGGMVWDAARQRVVLFGGYSDDQTHYKDAVHQDVWTWDGSNWTQQVTLTQPLRSYYLGLVYDDAIGKTLLYGADCFIIPDILASVGSGFFVYDKKVWLLDESGWTSVPDSEPNDRSGALIGYDELRRETILAGGACLDSQTMYCQDTWKWAGGQWLQIYPARAISAGTAVYDTVDQQLVVWSTQSTFTWDGSTWNLHPNTADPAQPPGLSWPGLARDATGRPILFGGVTYSAGVATYHNDTYRWDGNRWNKLNPANSPPGREIMQIAYDEARKQTVLYGGIGCDSPTPLNNCPFTYLSDTWTWDGVNWTQKAPAQNPGTRSFGFMSFDSGSQFVTLFGGTTDTTATGGLQNDTWIWDSANWTQLSPAHAPGALMSYMLVKQPPVSGLLLFGGQQDNPGRAISDTWTFGITPIPLQVVSVTSTTSTSSGVAEMNLPFDGSGIECRSGGTNKEYTLVFSFTNALASVHDVTIDRGDVAGVAGELGSDPHQYIVRLTGVGNAQRLTVTLHDVRDSNGGRVTDLPLNFSVLIGDVNRDGAVNSADISQVKSQSGAVLTRSNWRDDLNGDGAIDSADIAVAKSQSGTALP